MNKYTHLTTGDGELYEDNGHRPGLRHSRFRSYRVQPRQGEPCDSRGDNH